MKFNTKKMVTNMAAVWLGIITLLLYFIPFINFYKKPKLGYSFSFFSDLIELNSSYSKPLGIIHFVVFSLLVLMLLWGLFFTFVENGKIKSSRLLLFKSDLLSLIISYLFILGLVVELIFTFLLKNESSSLFVPNCGIFIILVVGLFFIFIMSYVYFKFDSIAPLVNQYEKGMVKKVIDNKTSNKTNKNDVKEEHYQNRAQRRAANKKK